MVKIVLIGAGSHVFSKATISDILSYPELQNSTITLMDIAQEPLDLITSFATTLVKQHGFGTKIEPTTNRREALEGTDYVFVTIAVGRRTGAQPDVEIPLKYGVDEPQDGVGTGGIFGGLRHEPARGSLTIQVSLDLKLGEYRSAIHLVQQTFLPPTLSLC